MADAAKHPSINGGRLISELKTLFSLPKTKRTSVFTYGFMFAFVGFTMFLAFAPSSNSSSPWFADMFTSLSGSNSSSTQSKSMTIFSIESYRSHFSSIFSYFSPKFSPPPNNTTRSQNTTQARSFNSNKQLPTSTNQTKTKDLHSKVEFLKLNRTIEAQKSPVAANQTENSLPKSPSLRKNTTGKGQGKVTDKGLVSNFSSSFRKKQSNGTKAGLSAKQGSEILVEKLMNCDLFDGEWVRDDSYPLYRPGSCSLIDEQFNCFVNGRPDNGYYKLKWKPKGCSLPRLNGSHMLELLRGKRLVFVGDSLNRNMWESLVCILRNSVKNQSKVYEAYGRHQFRSEPSYSFVFKDYDCTIEFFVSPFIVQEWETSNKNGSKKETLRLDMIGKSAKEYESADILIFNTGHWWTHEKTSKGKDYYQEGSHVYGELNVLEAFRKALTTWGRWVDANINPTKTLVLFRGYSASHFSGGQWNSGGQCDHETEPIKNKTYLSLHPAKMKVLESVLKGMKTRVAYLNVTRMTDYRKDGHPSIYRKQSYTEEERKSPLMFQDCSHWCLPGVPDVLNELLYAELLRMQKQKKQQQQYQKKTIVN